MRRTTALMSGFKAETQSGEDLNFELCKGGYFSDTEEYGLKVVGKTEQNGTPTVSSPKKIQCVAKHSIISCANHVTLPCDLYENDIWFPHSGKVERHNYVLTPEISHSSYLIVGDNAIPYAAFKLPKTSNNYYDYSRVLCNICTENQTISVSNTVIGFRALYSSTYNDNRILLRTSTAGTTDSRMYSLLQSLKTNGNPLTFVVGLNTPVIEQYEPLKLYATENYARVKQMPEDLEATLSATMLTLKHN